MTFEYTSCDCASPEHTIRWSRDEDGYVAQEVHLVHYKSLWGRLVTAVRYVFGYRSRYGHWDCVMLNEQQQEKLANFLRSEDNDQLAR